MAWPFVTTAAAPEHCSVFRLSLKNGKVFGTMRLAPQGRQLTKGDQAQHCSPLLLVSFSAIPCPGCSSVDLSLLWLPFGMPPKQLCCTPAFSGACPDCAGCRLQPSCLSFWRNPADAAQVHMAALQLGWVQLPSSAGRRQDWCLR